MAVKGLMQSAPHDGRILKAFALGLAVSTRGMDHLRNRVTLEINSRINDDPAFKERLYGGPVSAAPNAYQDKARAGRAVRRADDTLPDRWFDEPIRVGGYAGEKIDRAEFDAMISRFYALSNL